MTQRNIHATALVVGFRGLLILGESGSGKSLLAAALIASARNEGRFAALVADDRVWLSKCGDRLVAEAPGSIAGLLELRGYGPASVNHERLSVIDRVIVLVNPGVAPRMRDDARQEIEGVLLPSLRLAARSIPAASAAIMAWLSSPDD